MVNSTNLGILINYVSMKWGEFQHRPYYLCLAGFVMISLSLTQEVVGLNNLCYKKLDTEFNSVKTVRENSTT